MCCWYGFNILVVHWRTAKNIAKLYHTTQSLPTRSRSTWYDKTHVVIYISMISWIAIVVFIFIIIVVIIETTIILWTMLLLSTNWLDLIACGVQMFSTWFRFNYFFWFPFLFYMILLLVFDERRKRICYS